MAYCDIINIKIVSTYFLCDSRLVSIRSVQRKLLVIIGMFTLNFNTLRYYSVIKNVINSYGVPNL